MTKKAIDELVCQLKDSLLDSPHLAVMILDREQNIVWHNKRFAEEFKDCKPLKGKKCYNVTKAGKPHAGCPLARSMDGKSYTRGMFDFGKENFFFMTIPLTKGYAAKVHTYLPKQAKGMIRD